jgi:hypothetical protein
MYELEIQSWDVKIPTENNKFIERKENLIEAIKFLLGQSEQKQGFESFMIMHNIADAFNEAEKSNILKLEEREYDFVVNLIKEKVPAQWALNNKLSKQITEFLDLKK